MQATKQATQTYHSKRTGTLKRVIFQSESGYIIAVISLKDGFDCSVKGVLLYPLLGMEYTFYGQMEPGTPRYGPTFAFKQCAAHFPAKADGIKRYLQLNAKGIGPFTAEKLVKRFGDNTLSKIMDHTDEVVTAITGVSKESMETLATFLRRRRDKDNAEIELYNMLPKVTQYQVNSILSIIGPDAVQVIRENPYQLLRYNINGFGFKRVDSIAMDILKDPLNKYRLRFALDYSFKTLSDKSGGTIIPIKILLQYTANSIDVSNADLYQILKEMCAKAKHFKLLTPYTLNECTKYKDITSTVFLNKEKSIFNKLKLINESPFKRPAKRRGTVDLSNLYYAQKRAYELATRHKISIITGAPGTGKTYTLNKIVEAFDGQYKVSLAAPTGKAAKRLAQMTGRAATTIHKLLDPAPVTIKGEVSFVFQHDANNQLKDDVIVIDETSMVDTELMYKFLQAVPTTTKLIFVGDVNQLPSIRPGNLLHDMINSGFIESIELDVIKRQDPGLIIQNCQQVKNVYPLKTNKNKKYNDFYVINTNSEIDTKNIICTLVSENIPRKFNVDPLKDIQVLTAYRKNTVLSCADLNLSLQRLLNKNVHIEKSEFKIGDKVIQTKNDYDLDIMNGDIGYIKQVFNKEYVIDFCGEERKVPVAKSQNSLELAYAITVHKFQGSESQVVVVPINNNIHPDIITNNWLYTAISRASKLCVLVGNVGKVNNIIKNVLKERKTNFRLLSKGDNNG